MKKFLFLSLISIMLMVQAQDEIIVSLLNKTDAPLIAQVKNDAASMKMIQPNTTGFITIDRSDQRQIILSQESGSKNTFGTFARTGSIPTISLTNYSFKIIVDQANNLTAIPTHVSIKPNLYGPGIRGRL